MPCFTALTQIPPAGIEPAAYGLGRDKEGERTQPFDTGFYGASDEVAQALISRRSRI
ncbi:MAG: hypothetical protein ACRC2T_05460 [Thermoguttaceae bacterium]